MMMSLTKSELASYVMQQLRNYFPDRRSVEDVGLPMDDTLDRVQFCFSEVHAKYYKRGSETLFNHLNTDQYAMFLYFLSNTLHKRSADESLCEKVYFLNKALHRIDALYSVALPDIFLFSHPVGTVLGKAKYSNYLLVYQNGTIGSNHRTNFPVIGEFVSIYKGASVLGKCEVGDNCKISAHSLLMDRDLESNKIYIGTPSSFTIKECKYHDHIWDAK
jgi:serine O-acetyltransferase